MSPGCLRSASQEDRQGLKTVADRILEAVAADPGKSQTEIARALFGAKGYQQRVNSTIAHLVSRGLLFEDRNCRPMRYHPVAWSSEPSSEAPTGQPTRSGRLIRGGYKTPEELGLAGVTIYGVGSVPRASKKS